LYCNPLPANVAPLGPNLCGPIDCQHGAQYRGDSRVDMWTLAAYPKVHLTPGPIGGRGGVPRKFPENLAPPPLNRCQRPPPKPQGRSPSGFGGLTHDQELLSDGPLSLILRIIHIL